MSDVERERSAGPATPVFDASDPGAGDGHCAIAVVDADFSYLEVDAESARLAGQPAQALLGRSLWEALPYLRDTPLAAVLRRSVQDGVPAALERWRTAHGHWVDVFTAPRPGGGATFFVRDVTTRVRRERWAAHAQRVLELVARGRTLADVLTALCRSIEDVVPGALASVVEIDDVQGRMHPLAGPSLPPAVLQGIDGVATGPTVGSCGTAAARGEPVVSADLRTDPLWENVRHVPLASGLRSCWSHPIFGTGDATARVLGTFAVYRREPHAPDAEERHLVGEAAHLASVAITRDRADAELRRREAEFAALVQSSPDVIAQLDRELRYQFVSPAIAALTGYGPEELVGRRIGSNRTPEENTALDLPRWHAALRRVVETGEPGEARLVITRADGARRHLAARLAPMRDAVGDVTGVLSSTRDVTDEEHARAAVAASEARFRALVAELRDSRERLAIALCAADMGTWEWDVDADTAKETGLLALPDGAGERTRSRAARASFLREVHADDREAVAAALAAATRGERPYAAEFRVPQADGTVRWMASHGRLFTGPDGRSRRLVGVAMDVTARRLAEDALRRTNATLRAFVDAAPLAVVGVDAEWRVTLWNPAAERLFGWSAAEVLGAPSPVFGASGARELVSAVAHAVREAAGAPAAGRGVELTCRCKDGTTVDVSVSAGALGDGQGLVALVADVRERKLLEAQLRQAQKLEAVGQLAGGVAHDFNNLLTVIGGGADFLLATLPPGSSAAEDARDIRAAADRAAALTRQLLAFSRRQVLAPRPLDVNAVVRGVEPMLRRLIGADVALVVALGREAVGVRADAGQLDQVLLNLAVNARDAMPEGGVLALETREVTLDAAAAAALTVPTAAGRYALLEVTDTGVGMDEATQAHIFEPFFTTKALGRGTGLGLATVYGVVTQSGGGIDVRSAPGRGTTFRIHLPWISLDAPPAAVTPGAAAAGGRSALVLVVEDEAAVRATARRILERRGYAVLEARHGADALRLLRARAGSDAAGALPDVVVTDVNMPDMGGRVLAERLATEFPALPVVFVSGYAGGTSVGLEAAVRLPADADVLPKPFTGDELVARVERVLARRRSALGTPGERQRPDGTA